MNTYSAIPTRPTTTPAHAPDRRIYAQAELAKVLGVTHQAVSICEARALRKMRRAWTLWESIEWDTRRRGEIRRELAELEGGGAA